MKNFNLKRFSFVIVLWLSVFTICNFIQSKGFLQKASTFVLAGSLIQIAETWALARYFRNEPEEDTTEEKVG